MGKESISPINADEADVAIRRLEYLRNSLPELKEWFEKHPEVKELWCFRLFSLEEGLRRLESFLPEMRKAMQAHARGQPLGPSSTKTRGAGTKAKQAAEKFQAHKKKTRQPKSDPE